MKHKNLVTLLFSVSVRCCSIHRLDDLALRLYNSNIGKCKIASDTDIRILIEKAAQENPECHFI